VMRVLAVNPPFLPRFSREQRSPAVTKSGTLYYPMWLAYAVGVLEEAGCECKLLDCPARLIDMERLLQIAREFRPELVIIDTSTPSIYDDVKCGELIKEALPDSYILLVGTHPSALPEETLKLSDKIDGVCVGEYEETVRELVDALQRGERGVRGMVARVDGEILDFGRRELLEDLDKLPFVSMVYKRHLNYKDYFYSHSRYPIVTIVTGRGCPYRCVYCVYPQVFSGHRLRFRSIDSVLDEIEFILENFPDVKEIMFEDDTLTVKRDRCREFCEAILARGLRFRWSANSRADVDYQTLRLMRQAGCRLLCVGVESGVQDVLDAMRKNLTVEKIRRFFADARRAGVRVHGCFLLGTPGETKETLEATLQFAKELNPDTAQFFPIMVYPGTEAYRWAEENGYLTTKNFRQWLTEDGMHNCVVSRPGLSAEELVAFCDRARYEYYMRPAYIVRKLGDILFNPYEARRVLKAAVRFVPTMIRRMRVVGGRSTGC